MLTLKRLTQNPQFVCRGNPDLPVHARQWYERVGRDDGQPEAWCYTDHLSYAHGETVFIHAVSSVPSITIAVYSQTVTPELMLSFKSTVRWLDTPDDASVNGCQWPAIADFIIPENWSSGVYKISLYADGQICANHLIVVRPLAKTTKTQRLLLITSDCTWTAYNDWGGSNHYEGIINPQTNQFSAQLSLHRPFARGFIELPANAPRTLPSQPPQNGEIIYPHMEWAWQQGYSKKYASSGWASYERLFYNWVKQQGYECDIATQQDLHYRPHVLDQYRCVVFVGHDEYWSWAMRDCVDNFVTQGGNVARFAGNFMWQIRLQEQGQRQICHKYKAHVDDPLMNTPNQHLVTASWESDFINRPGHQTFGLNALKGLYAGWGGLAANGPGGFTLYRPQHWAFADSKLGYGDVLGAQSKIFGYEVDGLDYYIKNGLPFPESHLEIKEDIQILALGLARLREDNFNSNPDALFVADDDAMYVAKTLYNDCSEETLQRVDRGSGMIVHFHKDRGQVFHAGTTEWVAGLLRRDYAVEQVTRNVLNRFLNA